jgi:aliphatic nitrilase
MGSTAPSFFDRTATITKACRLIHGVAENGALLVAFPEIFVLGYRYWNWFGKGEALVKHTRCAFR